MSITKEYLSSLLSAEWHKVLPNIFDEIYWDKIIDTLNKCKFFPEIENVFAALNSCPPRNVKVVLLGQDPYPKINQAHGYSFSVNCEKPPPSLRNIIKELRQEYNIYTGNETYNLTKWSEEGVLLLNSILTIEENRILSHKNIGWENFTRGIMKYLALEIAPIFMLLGSFARDECTLVQNELNSKSEKKKIDKKDTFILSVIKAGHPSPQNISQPFVGSNIFIEVNKLLLSKNKFPIRWTLILK